MAMFNRMELERQAKQQGFVRDTYEKTCRLSQVLEFIGADGYLARLLALKGGTAINFILFDLPRLSVDIDLDLAINISKDEMIDAKEKITEKIIDFMSGNGYSIDEKCSKTTHALNSLVFSYINAGGVKDKIKVEVNYMLREHILRPEIYSVKKTQSFKDLKVLCLNPIEIYSAKITALLNRAAPRDLYDVDNMFKSGVVTEKDMQLLRKCIIFYKTINSEEAFNRFDLSAIDRITFNRIKAELFPVISRSEKKYDLSETLEFVKEQLENLLQMTPSETEFVERYFKKEYQIGLLFDSEEICNRLKSHPIIEWKFSHM